MIRCDGCASGVEPAAIMCVLADGHEGRYCPECHQCYKEFLAACLIVEEKYNRLLDAEIHAMRERTPLLFVPQDLPRAPRALEGLRLG